MERILKRRGRNSGRNKQILSVPQQNWRGVNYVDDLYTMPEHQLPFCQNVDLGNPIGSITKVAGFESLIPTLGVGKILGLHALEHSDGDRILAAHDKHLYLLSGDSGSVAKTSQADWDAGTKTNIDTASNPGDMKLTLSGTNFSETDTLTADFNGTHNNTEAASGKVSLVATTVGTVIASMTSEPSDASNNSCDYGWQFTVGANNVTATKLRIYAHTAFSTSLRIWRVSTGALLATVALTTVAHEWAEGTLSASLTLLAGQAYVISSYQPSGKRVHHMSSGYTLDPSIASANGGGTNYGSSGTMPKISTGTFIYGIVDVVLSRTSYAPSGTYTHPAQDISGIGVTTGVTITYNRTTPANTTLTVETRVSTDSGNTWSGWTARASGATVVASGTDVSNYRVQWRAILTTTDVMATPTLDDVTVAGNTGYYTSGQWLSPVYDLSRTPFTNVLSWVQTAPGGTSITWYACGSGNGTVFGDWQEITVSGDAIPLQQYIRLKFLFTGTLTATPTVSSLLINHSSSYTKANRLDISPLARAGNLLTGNRVRFRGYNDNCYGADGLRPFVLYTDSATMATGTAQAGTVNTIRLASGSSAVNDFFNNAFVTITGGTGSGQVRFISDYDGTTKDATVSENWTTNPDATSTYSIGAAVKVRRAGVDPPANACTAADGGGTGITGTFLYRITFVNRDGYESNPSAASNSITVSNKIVALSAIPTGDVTIAARRIYRTKTSGSVYYYVAEIANNTATTYSDTTADGSLTKLMLDNNNIPPNASIVYSFLSYMFYCVNDEMWFSKAGEPEQVPNITGDVQMNVLPSAILDIKNNPMALIPMGANFICPITTNSGFVFDSDPAVDTTTMRLIDKNGSLSFEASDICISPDLRSILVFPTHTGVRLLLPGLQEESIETIPMSRNIQSFFDRSVNRTTMAAIFHNNYYVLSMEYQDPAKPEAEHIAFAYDFRHGEWYGPWTFGCSCFAISQNVLYAGDPVNGKIYRMNTGSSFAGANIKMIADARMLSPQGENYTYKFNKVMLMVSADSDTTNMIVKPKVDNREVTVTPGVLTDTFTGDVRPGHNNIRSRKYRIPLAKGSTLSYRIEDDSKNPVSIQKIITECTILPLKR